MLQCLKREPGFYRYLWGLTGPIALQNLITFTLGLMDTLMVSWLGNTQMAAVTTANVPVFLLISIVFGVQSGVGILMEHISRAIGVAAMLGTGLTVVLAAVLYLWPVEIMDLLSNNHELSVLGAPYLKLIGISYVFNMLSSLYVSARRSAEDAGFGMKLFAMSTVLNTGLNYLLIFGKFGFPEMGIAGAAIASSISEGVSALFYILYTRYRTDWRRYKFRFTGFDFSLLKQILSLSVWVMIQQGVAFLAWFLFFLCIEHLGKRDLAATNIVRAVSSLIFMFINAFASTTSSLVSNLIGAGYTEQIMPLCRKMIRLCFCFVLPLCILAAAIPYWTLRIYTDDVSLIEYAIPSLWVMLTTNIPCTAAFIYQFSVSGTGNTRTALTIVACTSIVYVAYTALLVYGLHADVALCWTADHVYYGCTLTASYLYMRYGNWRARKI